MKYISFDVGIKNLAYAIIDISGSSITSSSIIHDWNILCLEEKYTCNICNKKASYHKNKTEFYCGIHVKSKGYITEYIKTSMTVEDAKFYAKKYKVDISSCKYKKNIIASLKEKQAYLIKSRKKTHPLVCHGFSLYYQLEEVLQSHSNSIDYVIIENQMTSKMRVIQAMLVQYFIGKGIQENRIICISPSKKLYKIKESTTYKERKQWSNEITQNILKEHQLYHYWETFVASSKKKDDLSDAFLQCIAYIEKK